MAAEEGKSRDELLQEIALLRREIKSLKLDRGAATAPPPPFEQAGQFLRRLADSLPQLVAYVDSDLIYRFVNRSYEKTFGVSASEILGQRVEEFIGHDAFDKVRAHVEKALAGEAVRYRLKLPYQQAGERSMDAHLVPDTDIEGRVFGYFAILQDITAFEEKETALEERERRYRHLFDNVRDAIYVYNVLPHGLPGKLVDTNEVACKRLGYSRGEMLQMSVSQVIAPEAWEDVIPPLMLSLRKEKGALYETVHMAKDGRRIPVENHSVLFERQGVQYVLTVSRDISKRKVMQREMEERERLLTGIVAHVPGIVYQFRTTADGEAYFPYVSRQVEELFGIPYREGGYSGRELLDRVVEEDRARILRDMEISAQGLTPVSHELRVVNAAGEERLLRSMATPLRQPDGVTLWNGVALDVTDEKETERQLQQTLARLSYHIENSPLGVVEWDSELRIMAWSGRSQDIFGYSPQEVLGRRFFDWGIVHEEDLGDVTYCVQRLVDGEESFNVSANRNYTRGGEVIYCRWYNSALHDEDGSLVSILSLVQDVTLGKRYEAELEKAKELAESASRAKSQFLANMSHEIRTPLNGIHGMLHLLDSTALDKEQAEYLDNAERSVRRLTHLLSDILDLSRVEADKLVLRDEDFNIHDVMDSLDELLAQSCREKGLSLTTWVHPGVRERLHGDMLRVQQVLLNLAGNAVKFTSSGGVLVEVYPLPADARTPAGCTRLLFSVTDTGIGIPEEMLDHMFEAFTQGEVSYTRRFGGAGLGLAIVKKLVTLMGGEVELSSELDKGTAIRFCLPFSVAEQEAPQPEKPQEPARSDVTGRVLLVEDDRVNQIAISRILTGKGHTVLKAGNGEEALGVLRNEQVDLVLMDIQMPVMDGIETTYHIRKDKEFRSIARIAIVALTAYAMAGDKEMLLDSGMDDYLAKPVDAAELLEAVARALASGRR